MMLPANRLLLLFAGVMLPASLVAALVPGTLGWSVLAAAVLLVLFGVDAWLARRVLTGVCIEVPERYNLTHRRSAECDFHVDSSRKVQHRVRIGLELPSELTSPWDDTMVDLCSEQARVKVAWPVCPERRGQFALQRCQLQARSPLGFWVRQESRPLASSVHVYPNLAAEQKRLAALFLNRGILGLHLHRQVGQGREFEKLREYLPGDSLNDIHWRGTAKRGALVTKQYQIERTQEIYVVIDASRLSARDSGGQSVLERYISAALVLNLVAQQQGDLFGLVTFSDRVHSFVRAKSGKPHFRVCQDALVHLHPQNVNPDFGELASFLSLRLRRRALVLMLTCLDESALAEAFEKDLSLVNRRHLVLVNMLRPQAARSLFSDAQVATAEDLYPCLGGHLIWQSLRELGRSLKTQGVDFHLLEEDKLSVELVSQYINVKRRQVL